MNSKIIIFSIVVIILLGLSNYSCGNDDSGETTEDNGITIDEDSLDDKDFLITENAAFRERAYHTAIVIDNEMKVIAGYDFDSNGAKLYDDETWSSTDGISWATSLDVKTSYSNRASHASVVFNDKIWVIGGLGPDGNGDVVAHNDIWTSEDGVNWTEIIPQGQYLRERWNHSAVVFENKIWVIGGIDSNKVRRNDVWSSTDGVTWELVTIDAEFSKRFGHSSVVFDNKIWVIGGFTRSGGEDVFLNDVWSSTDGVTWVEETSEAAFPCRTYHYSVVFNDQNNVIGGQSPNSCNNDIWSSSDGVNRTIYKEIPELTVRGGHSSVVFDDKIWIIGGHDDFATPLTCKNDVWAFD